MNTQHVLRPLALALLIAFAASACQEKPAETASDVADAQRERLSDVAEATRDLRQAAAASDAEIRSVSADAANRVAQATLDPDASAADVRKVTSEAIDDIVGARAEASTGNAEAAYELALIDARGLRKVTLELCDGLTDSAERASCKTAAESTYERAVTRAEKRLEQIREANGD